MQTPSKNSHGKTDPNPDDMLKQIKSMLASEKSGMINVAPSTTLRQVPSAEKCLAESYMLIKDTNSSLDKNKDM